MIIPEITAIIDMNAKVQEMTGIMILCTSTADDALFPTVQICIKTLDNKILVAIMHACHLVLS